jgi:hypothetical protein
MGGAYNLCRGGMPEGKRPLGRPKHVWENNIKMVIWEIDLDGVD